MPLHDYQCPGCQSVRRDVYRSCAEGAQARPPLCHACGEPMAWHPAIGAMDVGGGPTFHAFDTYDGRNNLVRVDSLHKLRDVERESEKMARDGVGQQVTWRMFSNDRSNRHVNTHGPDPSERPTQAAIEKYGPGIRRMSEEPERPYGPAVSDANTTALETN